MGLLALALCAGCGTPAQKASTLTSGQTAGTPTPSPVTLTLAPSSATLTTGQSVTFSSPFVGSVTWMVNGVVGGDATLGTIDSNGTYAAPVVPPASAVIVSGKLGNFAGVSDPTAQSTVTITNPAPQVAQLSPSAITAGSSSQVVIAGSGFNSQSTAMVNGQPVSTTYIDANHLQISPTTSAGTSSTVSVAVSNPLPGGGTSSTLSIFAAATGIPQQTTHPLVARLSSVLPSGASMFAEFGQDASYGFKTSEKAASSGAPVDLLVAGMKPSTSYHMRLHFVMPDSSEVMGEDEVFTTGDVPAARIPPVTVTQSGLTPSPGVELLDLVSGDSQQLRAAVVDLSGSLIWYYDYPLSEGIPLPIKPLADGNMGIVITRGQQVFREVDLTGQTVRQITVDQLNAQLAAAGSNTVLSEIHHDFSELPNGMIVLITSEIKNFDNLPGYPGTIPVLGDVLVALDPAFNIVWTWSSFDHLDVNRHPWFQLLPTQLPEPVYDWTHTNAVVYSARDKALIVSMRQQSWILKIDFNDGQGTGNILWRLGECGDFALVGGADPIDWFYNQHYPSLISNSGPVFQLGVFDNGDVRPVDSSGTLCGGTVPCYSRPVVMTIDETAKTATLDWAPQTLFSNFGGVLHALAPARIEYTFSTVPGTSGGRVVESTMDAAPQEILRLDTGQLCYRGVRLPSLYSGVAW